MLKQIILTILVLLCTVVANGTLLMNGCCPVHHGTPVRDESAAMDACIKNNFCHPVGKCIPCQLDAPSNCHEGSGDCGMSYACTIAVTGGRKDITAKPDSNL